MRCISVYYDDYVDTTTQAILRFRQGNFINLYSDEDEEEGIEKGAHITGEISHGKSKTFLKGVSHFRRCG